VKLVGGGVEPFLGAFDQKLALLRETWPKLTSSCDRNLLVAKVLTCSRSLAAGDGCWATWEDAWASTTRNTAGDLQPDLIADVGGVSLSARS